MKTRLALVRSLIFLAAMALAPVGITLAHGEPVIAVQPAIVAAGGQIIVTGTEMEPGEVFAITLEGVSGSIPLGEATVAGEGEEGGFTVTFTIPAKAVPGSYTVSAAAEDGDTTTADLTITAPSEEASAAPAMAQEPTGELHAIDRSKPIGQIIAVVVVIALSTAAGFVLIRSQR
jgi:hypothetical protein